VASLFGRQSRVRRVERVWDPCDADIRVLEKLRAHSQAPSARSLRGGPVVRQR